MNRKLLLPALGLLLSACGQDALPHSPSTTAAAVHATFFHVADRNGDGVLDAAEIAASLDLDFARLDVNGDGVVTVHDVHNAQQALAPGHVHNPDLSHHLPYDADDDGVITRAEYRTHKAALVAEMDLDGDGVISFAEYRTARRF